MYTYIAQVDMYMMKETKSKVQKAKNSAGSLWALELL